MHEGYNSILSKTTKADKIGHFGRYRYIGKTQISVDLLFTLMGLQQLVPVFTSGPSINII